MLVVQPFKVANLRVNQTKDITLREIQLSSINKSCYFLNSGFESWPHFAKRQRYSKLNMQINLEPYS